MTFDELWAWIRRAHEEDWTHVKRADGIKQSPAMLLVHMTEELGEISKALTTEGNDLEEIADLMGLLMHYAIAIGFSNSEVLEQMETKLKTYIVEPED